MFSGYRNTISFIFAFFSLRVSSFIDRHARSETSLVHLVLSEHNQISSMSNRVISTLTFMFTFNFFKILVRQLIGMRGRNLYLRNPQYWSMTKFVRLKVQHKHDSSMCLHVPWTVYLPTTAASKIVRRMNGVNARKFSNIT